MSFPTTTPSTPLIADLFKVLNVRLNVYMSHNHQADGWVQGNQDYAQAHPFNQEWNDTSLKA